jgi:hypothetical protein
MSRWTLRDRSEPTLGPDDAAGTTTDPVLAIVDDALSLFAGRTLLAGSEVVDRLLDLRNALATATALRELEMTA